MDQEDALLQAGAKFNAWIQKVYNLLNYKRDGPRFVRLYGTRSKMQPPQPLVKSITWFRTLEELTDSPLLKKIAKVYREHLQMHSDLYSRFPLPYEDLDDIFRAPTMNEMEYGYKVSSLSSKEGETKRD